MLRRFAIAPLVAAALAWAGPALACLACRPLVKAELYDGEFAKTFLMLSLPVFIICVIGLAVHHSDEFKAAYARTKEDSTWPRKQGPDR